MDKEIPDDHPRAQSLRVRHKIIDGMKKLVVAEAGLIAQGRGEAWDYLIGEKTNDNAFNAMNAAVAMILSADYPVISINGNAAALCPEAIVKFADLTKAKLEINIFYAKPGRIEAITKVMRDAGAKKLYGTINSKRVNIQDLSSNRRYVDPEGMKIADVVMVPLEDGDRTEALIKENKKVIAIDLNPINRTSQWANITVVDNLVRAMDKMIEIAQEFRRNNMSKEDLKKIVAEFDNKKNLSNAINYVKNYLESLAKEGIFLKFKK